jgi:hypothetical protein
MTNKTEVAEDTTTLTAGEGILIDDNTVKIDGSIVAKDSDVTTLETQFGNLSTSHGASVTDISTLQTTTTNHGSSISALQTTTTSHGSSITTLQTNNALPVAWVNVILTSGNVGIGDNPLGIDGSGGRPPGAQFLKIPFGDHYMVKARGMVNLGGAVTIGSASTYKSIVLLTLTGDYVPTYTYSFTVNGHLEERRGRVDVYGSTHPTVSKRGWVEFVAGGSEEGIQYVNLCQMEWMTN